MLSKAHLPLSSRPHWRLIKRSTRATAHSDINTNVCTCMPEYIHTYVYMYVYLHTHKDYMLVAVDSQLRLEWRNCWTRADSGSGLSSQVMQKSKGASGASATAIATALLLPLLLL